MKAISQSGKVDAGGIKPPPLLAAIACFALALRHIPRRLTRPWQKLLVYSELPATLIFFARHRS